jgi:hypothetical protein
MIVDEMSSILKKKNILFVFDDCDALCANDEIKFGNYVQSFLESYAHCSLLITCQRPLARGPAGFTQKMADLGSLHALDAAWLFVNRAPRDLHSRDTKTPLRGFADLANYPIMRKLNVCHTTALLLSYSSSHHGAYPCI